MAMQIEQAFPRMTSPKSIEAALDDLAAGGRDAVPVAGATWVMRSPLRHEPQAKWFVSLDRVEGFRRLDVAGDAVSIGPLATHDAVVQGLPDTSDLKVLRQAAGHAANPGVRRIATIGGNICAAAFAASDFAPALLSVDATIELADMAGPRHLPVENFLADRTTFEKPWLVTGIVVPRSPRLTAHQRLPMRRAGDYPCAIVSVAIDVDEAGRIREARIGVGAVEATARRWHNLEKSLEGQLLDTTVAEAARDLLADFAGRDAVDAPGWYRISILPVLVRRAFETLKADHAGWA